jgi:hypothetical protein
MQDGAAAASLTSQNIGLPSANQRAIFCDVSLQSSSRPAYIFLPILGNNVQNDETLVFFERAVILYFEKMDILA